MLRQCGGTYAHLCVKRLFMRTCAHLCEAAPIYVKIRSYEWKTNVWLCDMQRDINLSFNKSADSLQSLGHIYFFNNAL